MSDEREQMPLSAGFGHDAYEAVLGSKGRSDGSSSPKLGWESTRLHGLMFGNYDTAARVLKLVAGEHADPMSGQESVEDVVSATTALLTRTMRHLDGSYEGGEHDVAATVREVMAEQPPAEPGSKAADPAPATPPEAPTV